MLLKSGRIFLGLLLVAIFAGHSASWYRLPLLIELETIMLDMRIRAITPHAQDDRIAMGKLTFRLLKKYQLIAENAARGKFPVDEKVEMSEFKYAEIAQRLLLHSKWVREEKARLKDL